MNSPIYNVYYTLNNDYISPTYLHTNNKVVFKMLASSLVVFQSCP